MTTLAADINLVREEGKLNDMPVIAADIIYQGAAVGDNASGYARPLVAGDPFRGFARMQADNSTGVAGDIKVNLLAEGRVVLNISALAITDVGKAVYASDDATFTLTATSNSYIGRVIRWVSTGVGVVGFDVEDSIGIIAGLTDNTGGTANTTLVDGLTAVALTENAGAIGGVNDGNLPDLTATAATLTGTLTGTTNGVLVDVAATAAATAGGATPSAAQVDAGIATAVASIVTGVNEQNKELMVMVNAVIADNIALRAAIREIATMTNTQTTDLGNQNNNDADLAGRINLIAQALK